MISLRKTSPARVARSVLLAACALSAIGCDTHVNVEVTGTVTLDGELVRGGTIYFWDELPTAPDDPGHPSSTVIGLDGTYRVTLVTDVNYVVTLTNEQAPDGGVIPERYSNAATSGLSLYVPYGYGTTYTSDIRLTRLP